MKPLPEGLPPLPEGAVYLGEGGTFKVPRKTFDGWAWMEGEGDWEWGWDAMGSVGWGGSDDFRHYAAPADSETARLNQDKPSWRSAPDWAEWLAQDRNGDWRWFSQKPDGDFLDGVWHADDYNSTELANSLVVAPNWRETLERRPKATRFGFEEEARRVVKALAEFSFDERDEPDLAIPADIDSQCTYAEIEPIIQAAKDMGYSIEWSEDGGVRGWKK